MEVRAIAKYQRVQPRKVRIVADEVRGKNALYAASLLRYHRSKGAQLLLKVLKSAIANAQENNQLTAETLRISTIMVDEGPRLKRIQARAMGRGNRIIKKTSHITVCVEEGPEEAVVKPHGTKPKPRPTFKTAKKSGSKAASVAAAAAPVDELTDTDAETVTAAEPTEAAATQPEEATPVTESDAPEEAGSASPEPVQQEAEGQETGPSADEEDNK